MKLLRLPDLIARGLGSRSSIYVRMERGEFPRPIKIGRINGWPEHEIDAWIEQRLAEREAA
jgi:prophage regulatory protein